MNHLTPEIVIRAPADPAEPRFAAGRILTRHEANPRRKFPPGAEMTAVVHCGNERRCDYRANARQPREPPTGFVRPAKDQELPVEFVEPEIDGAEFFEKVGEELSREIRELRGRDRVLRLRQKAPCALGQDDAILTKKPAHMIDERSSGADNALPRAMKGLQILLLKGFDRNEYD